MIKRLAKGLLTRLALPGDSRPDGQRLALYKYTKPDGSFDYERYRQVQTDGNIRKLDYVWANEGNIAFMADYIRRVSGAPKFGICHGTRRGREQEWFRKHLGCEVIGTEISSTATQFPHTIQWDFHQVKPEWIDATDFIYSNSFDHSYDPEACLNAWMSCIRPGGLCLLEHSNFHAPEGVCELDPFGADIVLMPYLIATWGRGRYCVREIMEAPNKKDDLAYLSIVVIQRL